MCQKDRKKVNFWLTELSWGEMHPKLYRIAHPRTTFLVVFTVTEGKRAVNRREIGDQ
jgi:hypothetical protein